MRLFTPVILVALSIGTGCDVLTSFLPPAEEEVPTRRRPGGEGEGEDER